MATSDSSLRLPFKAAPGHSGDEGFTLIELLVVTVIMGVLAGLAIAVFLGQREKALDSSLRSDLNSAAKTAESLTTDAPLDAGAFTAADFAGEGFTASPENEVAIAGSRADGYCVRAFNDFANADSAANAMWFDSEAGGLAGAPGGPPVGGACEGVAAGLFIAIG